VSGPQAQILDLDPTGLHTVVNELLENVLAHAGAGAQPLKVAIRLEQQGNRCFIHVEDNGLGMDAQPSLHTSDQGTRVSLEFLPA